MAIWRVWMVLWVSFRSLRRLRAGAERRDGVKLRWASEVLSFVGARTRLMGKPYGGGPVILVGNHLSYLDIALLLRFVPAASFVGKEELRSWPLFGACMEEAGTVFVRRESLFSRGRALEELRERIFSGRRPVVIFPSGTTSLAEEKPWRGGAFRLAAEGGIPLQAFRIRYFPPRPAAFIGDDSFLLHLWRLCRGGLVAAHIEFAEPETVSDPLAARRRWNLWCRGAEELGAEPLEGQALAHADEGKGVLHG